MSDSPEKDCAEIDRAFQARLRGTHVEMSFGPHFSRAVSLPSPWLNLFGSDPAATDYPVASFNY
jgi:hypothetical protein